MKPEALIVEFWWQTLSSLHDDGQTNAFYNIYTLYFIPFLRIEYDYNLTSLLFSG